MRGQCLILGQIPIWATLARIRRTSAGTRKEHTPRAHSSQLGQVGGKTRVQAPCENARSAEDPDAATREALTLAARRAPVSRPRSQSKWVGGPPSRSSGMGAQWRTPPATAILLW